ncbi:MAG: YeeE/YedE family protein, partial [Chitinophagaceae bacterium]
MMEFLSQPWPWYVAGPIMGLTVPALLLLGNKHFGISANLRHACAACFPARIPFFRYNWKKEIWNIVFVSGILIGAVIAANLLHNPAGVKVAPALVEELSTYGINNNGGLLPPEIFSFESLFSLRGFILLVGGGFL